MDIDEKQQESNAGSTKEVRSNTYDTIQCEPTAGLTNGRTRMDFRERVPFGRTGLMVSRIGLASGYGVPTAAIEKAFHEYGVNYFWLSFLNCATALSNVA